MTCSPLEEKTQKSHLALSQINEARYDQLWFLRHLDPSKGFRGSSLSS